MMGKLFAQLALNLFSYCLLIVISIVSMMWGWGIQPQSWGWIAFGWLSNFILALIQVSAERAD